MKQTVYILAILILTSCQMRNTWECEGDCNNGKGTKKWKDGGIERGTWKNGELIGQGYQFFGKTSEFAGDSYEGEFLHGYNGFGKYIDVSSDATYIGYYKDGKHDGKGKLTFGQKSEYPNRYYDGEWKNGKRHGHGVNFWGEGGKYTNNRYEGEWKNDEMDGFGRYDWPDKGTYIGPWKNGEQNGEGIYIFLNGDTLKSKWIDGYCRELALVFYGESASTFKTLLEEINNPSYELSQKFIDETVKELRYYKNNSSYNVDFIKLREQLDSALIAMKIVIPKLENIKEYDSKIRYKEDFLKVQYALLEVLNECNNWINLNLENVDSNKTKQSYDSVFEKLKVMKQEQNNFEKTKKKFIKKYW
jgi:hypothetical protein